MAITRLSTTLANACVQQIKTALDSGGGPGFLKIYDGVIPATPDTALTNQTLLSTLTLSYPCGTVSGKVLTFGAIATSSYVASGVARFGRLFNSTMTAHLDLNISLVNGGGSLLLTSTAAQVGEPVRVESLYIVVS